MEVEVKVKGKRNKFTVAANHELVKKKQTQMQSKCQKKCKATNHRKYIEILKTL